MLWKWPYALLVLAGCNSTVQVVGPPEACAFLERLTHEKTDKIDLLVMVDNSRAMLDKQAVLQQAIPSLVQGLVNPLCVCDSDAGCGRVPRGEPLPARQQPLDPLADCPPGSKREFDPIFDIHIGVITSSLGGHGADSCEGEIDASENDHGHLINRDAASDFVPTWDGKKFLVWDPKANTHTPPGETNVDALIQNFSALVGGAGEMGCGYESQLESWYRFLIDPDPYATITIELDAGGNPYARLDGMDTTLLEMRKDFLRPDSLVAIVMLSDENDCSIRDGAQYFFVGQRYVPGTNNPYHLPRARAVCATNPNDPCCRSCGEPPGAGCDDSADDCSSPLGSLEDSPQLRCFDQKRRFGIDFLQPIDRYVTGLSALTVPDRNGQVVPNPLFTGARNEGMVVVAGIVGVPWQDIARRNVSGQPDLVNGLDAKGRAVGGFQSASELTNNGTWSLIFNDDPLMKESVDPRFGTHPVTGEPLAPPGDPNGNSINGSEYTIPNQDDLQYACIFDLPMPHDCNTYPACECPYDSASATNDPLCDPNTPNTQIKAKALPGIRELQVLQGAGSQGVVASTCPAQLVDATRKDHGYLPAVYSILEATKRRLRGQCLPRTLPSDAEGHVPCEIVEARKIGNSNDCAAVCSSPGRRPLAADHPAVLAAQQDPLFGAAQWNCFCEITQTESEDLAVCHRDLNDNPTTASGQAVDGWCYVDATTGNPALVEACLETERQRIRFVGQGQASPGATLFLHCSAC